MVSSCACEALSCCSCAQSASLAQSRTYASSLRGASRPQTITFTLGGISATPMAMFDDKGNGATFDTVSNKWTERLARALAEHSRRVGT